MQFPFFLNQGLELRKSPVWSESQLKSESGAACQGTTPALCAWQRKIISKSRGQRRSAGRQAEVAGSGQDPPPLSLTSKRLLIACRISFKKHRVQDSTRASESRRELCTGYREIKRGTCTLRLCPCPLRSGQDSHGLLMEMLKKKNKFRAYSKEPKAKAAA